MYAWCIYLLLWQTCSIHFHFNHLQQQSLMKQITIKTVFFFPILIKLKVNWNQFCNALFVFWFPMQIPSKRLSDSPIFLQLRVKSRGQRSLKVTLVRGYNLESLWLCLLQNKVEELNQRLKQAIDGQFRRLGHIIFKQQTHYNKA